MQVKFKGKVIDVQGETIANDEGKLIILADSLNVADYANPAVQAKAIAAAGLPLDDDILPMIRRAWVRSADSAGSGLFVFSPDHASKSHKILAADPIGSGKRISAMRSCGDGLKGYDYAAKTTWSPKAKAEEIAPAKGETPTDPATLAESGETLADVVTLPGGGVVSHTTGNDVTDGIMGIMEAAQNAEADAEKESKVNPDDDDFIVPDDNA